MVNSVEFIHMYATLRLQMASRAKILTIPEGGNQSLTHIVRISTQNNTKQCLQIIDYPTCKNHRFNTPGEWFALRCIPNRSFLQFG